MGKIGQIGGKAVRLENRLDLIDIGARPDEAFPKTVFLAYLEPYIVPGFFISGCNK